MKNFFLPFILLVVSSVLKYANAQEITITLQSAQNVTCNGGNDGAINVTVVENNYYYQISGYQWSNGANTLDIANLTAGTYTLSVTDTWDITETFTMSITEPGAIEATFTTVADTGTLTPTGKAIPLVTGGTSPYNYFWSTSATTDSLTGIINGNYSLTVTDSKTCVSHEFDFSVGSTATAVQNVNQLNSQLTIYPNPAVDYLSIVTTASGNELEITDMLGHSVYAQHIINNQISINVNDLAPGLYFTRLKSERGSIDVKKFIKE